jgi:hypothetical protein
MSQEEIEKLKRDYEDAVVKELRGALPAIHVKEIRRLVKEFEGDGNKVLEFLSAVISNEESQETREDQPTVPPTEVPRPPSTPTESHPDPQQDTLSLSLEILSLNPEPSATTPATDFPLKEDSLDPSFEMEQQDDPKEKARQRRNVSAARKQRLVKKEQKEAAKRRKHIQALGMEKMDDTISTTAQEHVLKAIVI